MQNFPSYADPYKILHILGFEYEALKIIASTANKITSGIKLFFSVHSVNTEGP